MAGNGPSGIMTAQVLEERQKCPRSPTKRQYPTMASAQDAATWRTRETGINIQAYACPDCGYFHLSRTSRLDRVLPSTDGTVVTTSMAANQRKLATTPPPERVDMSEILAAETPIVPGNPAATEKLVANMVEGKESVTVPELIDALQISRFQASQALRNLGWQGTRGRPEWLPPGVERPGTKRVKPGKTVRGTSSATALTRARKKKLKSFLADKDAVSLAEVQVALSAGKDVSKALLHQLGWEPGRGQGSRGKWVPTAEAAVLQRTPLQELMASHAAEQETPPPPARPRALRAVEQLPEEDVDVAEQETAEVTPAAAAAAPVQIPAPVSTPITAQALSELGWRSIPNPEGVRTKTIEQMIQDLAPYGLEVRIQIREKR